LNKRIGKILENFGANSTNCPEILISHIERETMLKDKISPNSANPFPHANCSKFVSQLTKKNSQHVHHYNGM
jgi:hypothetical protein